MSEVATKDGSWTFDGEIVRIVPGRDRAIHALRKALGELTVPLAAISGVSFHPGRKGGRLRLRPRDGADPFMVATGGQLPDGADPYGLRVPPDRTGAAEFLVDEVRNALLLDRVPTGPTDRFLLPSPSVPVTATAGDGTVTFDGRAVHLEWNWMAEDHKKSAGAQTIDLADLVGVEWSRQTGFGHGRLRLRVKGASATLPPEHDPHSLAWGIRKEGGLTPLVAAAVVARLPHPNATLAGSENAPELSGGAASDGSAGADHDVVLRRLRELGELHRDGTLTADEFAAAKQALLRRL